MTHSHGAILGPAPGPDRADSLRGRCRDSATHTLPSGAIANERPGSMVATDVKRDALGCNTKIRVRSCAHTAPALSTSTEVTVGGPGSLLTATRAQRLPSNLNRPPPEEAAAHQMFPLPSCAKAN